MLVVINVYGTSGKESEEFLQGLTHELLEHCRKEYYGAQGYVVFPADRMQMDLGAEIVAQVFCGSSTSRVPFSAGVGFILKKWFTGAKIGVQLIDASTTRDLY